MNKNNILVFLLMLTIFTIKAQEPVDNQKVNKFTKFNPKLRIGLGVNYATGKEFKKVFGLGNTLSGELSLTLTNKLDLVPRVTLSYYGNFLNEALRDDLFLSNIGCSLMYFPSKHRKIAFVGGINGILGNEKIRLRKGYVGDNIALYFHRGFSVMGGIELFFEKSSLEMNYNYVFSFAKVKNDAVKLYQRQLYGDKEPPLYTVLELPNAQLNLSNIQLTYKFQFKL